ncbi:MAG: hypothetical protein R3B40_04370 [Polyangiales bacterium]|nr:hypothetical protein [Myxococcales bacterium]MCB9660193.1 hypothetical protein [Sandaracinaceae bacterium]
MDRKRDSLGSTKVRGPSSSRLTRGVVIATAAFASVLDACAHDGTPIGGARESALVATCTSESVEPASHPFPGAHEFGTKMDVSGEAAIIAGSGATAGSSPVAIYRRDAGGTWSREAILDLAVSQAVVVDNGASGVPSVAIDGDRAVVAFVERHVSDKTFRSRVEVFTRWLGAWTRTDEIVIDSGPFEVTPSNDHLLPSVTVAMDGGDVIVAESFVGDLIGTQSGLPPSTTTANASGFASVLHLVAQGTKTVIESEDAVLSQGASSPAFGQQVVVTGDRAAITQPQLGSVATSLVHFYRRDPITHDWLPDGVGTPLVPTDFAIRVALVGTDHAVIGTVGDLFGLAVPPLQLWQRNGNVYTYDSDLPASGIIWPTSMVGDGARVVVGQAFFDQFAVYRFTGSAVVLEDVTSTSLQQSLPGAWLAFDGTRLLAASSGGGLVTAFLVGPQIANDDVYVMSGSGPLLAGPLDNPPPALSANIDPHGILANDDLVCHETKISIDAPPTMGTLVTLEEDGAFQYQREGVSIFACSDSFRYHLAASDASESESATVRIDFDTCAHFNVYAEIWKRYIYTGCWPGPVDPIDPGSLGVRASADRPAHVVLPDGDGLSMRILERPRGGEASVDAGGLVYVPRRDFVGRDRVYVDVGNGSCSVRTVIDIDVPATGVAR